MTLRLPVRHAPPTTGLVSPFTLPLSIDSTGATDVTAAVTNYIAAVPDGTVGSPTLIQFQPNGLYTIDGTVVIANRKWLTIDLNGATLRPVAVRTPATPNVRTLSAIRVSGTIGSVGVKITSGRAGGTIKGSNPATDRTTNVYNASYEAQHCIEFSGKVDQFTVDGVNGKTLGAAGNLRLLNCYGDLVYIAGNTVPTSPTNGVISQFYGKFAARQGVSPVSCSSVSVHDNFFEEVARHAYDVEPDGTAQVADTITFADNIVGYCRLGHGAAGGQGAVSNVACLRDTTHEVAPGWTIPVHGSIRTGFRIVDNTYDLSWGAPAGNGFNAFTNVDGVTITGNTGVFQTPARHNFAATLTGCTGTINVSGNSFPPMDGQLLIRPYAIPTPAAGPDTGGTTVRLLGTDLLAVVTVKLGGVAIPFTVVSDTELDFVTPVATLIHKTNSWTFPTSTALGSNYIERDSIVVKNTAGTVTYVEGVDYNVFARGIYSYRFTRITAGAIPAGATVTVTYNTLGGGLDVALLDSYGGYKVATFNYEPTH